MLKYRRNVLHPIYIGSFHERYIMANIDIINDSYFSGLTIRPCFRYYLVHMIHFDIITSILWFSGIQSCCARSELRSLTYSDFPPWPLVVSIIWGSISHFIGYRWTGHNLFPLEWICTSSQYNLVECYLTDYYNHFTSQHLISWSTLDCISSP